MRDAGCGIRVKSRTGETHWECSMLNCRDGGDGQRSSEFWVLSSGLEADKKSGMGERGTDVLGSEF